MNLSLFKISAEFQRSNPLSAPRIEMNVGLGNTSYINIHKLKREVDSLKQRQQEIQLFNQVNNIVSLYDFPMNLFQSSGYNIQKLDFF